MTNNKKDIQSKAASPSSLKDTVSASHDEPTYTDFNSSWATQHNQKDILELQTSSIRFMT